MYIKSLTNDCVLLDTQVRISATDTEQAVDRSGWMFSHVLVVKQTLPSVDIMDGELRTVITLRTSQYRAINLEVRNLDVSNFIVVVLCVVSGCNFVHDH